MTSIKPRCGGLLVFLYVTIVILLKAMNGEACDKYCSDKLPIHCHRNRDELECELNSKDAFFCQVTCGVCTPCIHKPYECERQCFDRTSTFFCRWMKFLDYCYLTRGSCRKTCGNCVPCELPPKPTPTMACKPNCRDRDWECTRWEREGHCISTSKYVKTVKSLCEKTCKVCTPCGPYY